MNGPSALTSMLINQASEMAETHRADKAIQEFKITADKIGDLKAQAQAKKMVELEKAAVDFESMFLHMMMKQMRATIPKNDFFGDSKAEEIFTDMRDMEMSKDLSKAGGMGLAPILIQQLKGSL